LTGPEFASGQTTERSTGKMVSLEFGRWVYVGRPAKYPAAITSKAAIYRSKWEI